MRRSRVQVALVLVLTFLGVVRAQARGGGIFIIALRFAPQESVADAGVLLAPTLSDRPLLLKFTDGRTVSDPAVIGESDDDDERVPIRASNDVVAWVDEVLRSNAADWGVRTAADAPMALSGKLARLHLLESHKAVGSTYNAVVQVAFTLTDARGRTLWEGSAMGDATRYGKKRSEENSNEVLSDATKEAFANLFNDAGLQSAWAGRAAPAGSSAASTGAPTGPPVTPAELLVDLVKLKKQGFTTELLVDFVAQRSLGSTLSADDLVAWKKAGISDEVIKAAIDRARG